MSDQPDKDQPAVPPDSEVLARIPKGAADHALNASASEPAEQHQQDSPTNVDPLKRPRGALLAMRKSGGIRFTWRLLVVRSDGTLIYKSNALGAPRTAQVIGQLEADQLAELQALIARTDFRAGSPATARPSPDAFAYELIARVGRKNVFVEAIEGSIPAGLKPLIQWLNRLLPRPDDQP